MISREQARELSSKPELELVEQSFSPEIDRLSSVGLRDRISRSRDLHDKYRDLARGQHRQREARAPGAEDDARTEQKAQLFEEARRRFVERLESLGESYPG